MKISRINLCLLFLLLTYFFILSPQICLADEKYPTKTIKFIVPFDAGGHTDVISRKLTQLVSNSIGQEIIVDNKPGASGLVGSSFLAKSKADGYTIGAVTSATFVVSPNYTKMDFDPFTELTPILQVCDVPQMLSVPTNSQIKTFKEFVEEARKRPVTVSSGGLNSAEIAFRRIAVEEKINLKMVPFGGSAPARIAALGGQVDACLIGGIYEYVRAGQLRVLVMLSETRFGLLKETPTLKELGYDIKVPSFNAVFAPRGLPDNIKRKLEEEFTKALHDPSIKQTIEVFGNIFFYRNSKELANYVKEAYEQARKDFKELRLGIYAK